MKHIISALVLAITTLAFTKKTEFRPPGTVKIVDGFFFDKTELTNMDWQEYVYWQKANFGQESLEYLGALPDTTVWRYDMNNETPDYEYNEPLVNTYYNHPAYNAYPVVGITYNQAVAYCEWRTDRVKEMILLNDRPENRELVKNLKYRLPTKTEWELIAKSGKDMEKMEKWKKKKKAGKGAKLYNVKCEPTDDLSDYTFTAPVHSFLGNKYEIHNLFGNVAEMIAEPGIAKGGSYLHSYDETLSMKDINYEKPTKWLGFRCVCEL